MITAYQAIEQMKSQPFRGGANAAVLERIDGAISEAITSGYFYIDVNLSEVDIATQIIIRQHGYMCFTTNDNGKRFLRISW